MSYSVMFYIVSWWLYCYCSALTVEDEKRQISQLISQLVLRVDHGQDFEQQLSFYVDARAAFSNLDYVHAVLVQVYKFWCQNVLFTTRLNNN